MISTFLFIKNDLSNPLMPICDEKENCEDINKPVIIGIYNERILVGVCHVFSRLTDNDNILYATKNKLNLKQSNNFIKVFNLLCLKESSKLFLPVNEDDDKDLKFDE